MKQNHGVFDLAPDIFLSASRASGKVSLVTCWLELGCLFKGRESLKSYFDA
jgi:hypothetical protein